MTPGADPRATVAAVGAALRQAPAYRQLGPEVRRDLDHALDAITSTMGGGAHSRAFADPPVDPAATSGSTTGSSAGPVSQVGAVARSTLGAIDFPSFVSGLIKGTFQAIVDSSIQQMEAYSTMLKEVAKTVDDYMADNVTEDAARDYLADRYPTVVQRDTTGGTPTLQVDKSNPTAPLPSFFGDLGFDNAAQLDPNSVEEVVVPAARKSMAEQRHQTLATMVLMGLNRIVVDDGEINAKLMFHIDASETTEITFDSTQTSMGNMAGISGQSRFSGQGIMVNTANVNSQSDINVRADLTGEVKVRFSSDVMPLERFADSNAIQLINQHATVPAKVAPADEGATGQDADGGSPSAAGQSLGGRGAPPSARPGLTDDPWGPRR